MRTAQKYSLTLSAIALLGTGLPAFADDHDEIVVTGMALADEKFSATKTPTLIINVPQSLSITTDEQIAQQGFTSIGDVIAYTPGVSMGLGEGHRDQLTIRGQNTTADFFLDGLRDDVQYFRPLYNIAQIEVLRGSNAMIFGRGGGGGIINRVTKRPVLDESFNTVSAGIDSFGSFSAATDNNLQIGDQAALRLNGFFENLENHRDFYEGERFALNPTARLKLTDATQIGLSYEYVDDDRTVDRGVPSLGGAPLEDFNATFFGDPDANQTTLAAHIARARIDHKFDGDWSVNATLQYADYDKLYQNLYPVNFDDVAGTVTLDGYRDTTGRQNFVAQTNLVGELDLGGFHHTVLLGAEYADQNSDNARRDVFFDASADDQISFAFSNPLSVPAFSFPAFTRNRASDVEVFSIYGQNQIDIGDHLKLIGGVRFDSFSINVDDRIAAAQFSRKDEEFSPRLGVIYKPQNNVSLYGSFSRSFLPRSGDQFLSLSPTTAALAPEAFRNYEIGAKWDLNSHLALTAAMFQLDRENGTVVDPSDAGNSLLTGSRTQGFEFQLQGQLSDHWFISTGYSYLDAKERGRVSGGILDNRHIAQVPQHMLSLWNRYDVSEKLGFGLGATYQDAQFASISNAVELPDYVQVDAAVYYGISEDMELQLNVQNLLDSGHFPSAHNDNNIATAKPLHGRVTLRTKF